MESVNLSKKMQEIRQDPPKPSSCLYPPVTNQRLHSPEVYDPLSDSETFQHMGDSSMMESQEIIEFPLITSKFPTQPSISSQVCDTRSDNEKFHHSIRDSSMIEPVNITEPIQQITESPSKSSRLFPRKVTKFSSSPEISDNEKFQYMGDSSTLESVNTCKIFAEIAESPSNTCRYLPRKVNRFSTDTRSSNEKFQHAFLNDSDSSLTSLDDLASIDSELEHTEILRPSKVKIFIPKLVNPFKVTKMMNGENQDPELTNDLYTIRAAMYIFLVYFSEQDNIISLRVRAAVLPKTDDNFTNSKVVV
jgi:hypothetical protein